MSANHFTSSEREPLPAGWRWARLGDLCVTTETRDPRREPDIAFKYVDITSVDNVLKRIIDAREILGKDAPSRARQVIRARDVIVSTTRPNLNAVALVPHELDNQICSTGFCVLRPTQEIDSGFLFAFVQTPVFINELSEAVKGALYPAVNDAQVRSVEIPLPPLPEQRRIAARLNAVMAEIARARAAAQTALDAANALRFSSLRVAFDSKETNKWSRVRLGEISIVGPNDGAFKRREEFGRGVPFINVSDSFRGMDIDLSKTERAEASDDELRRYSVAAGDLFFCRSSIKREGVGWCAYITNLSEPSIFDSHIMRVRLDPQKAFFKYVAHYWAHPDVRGKVIDDSRTQQ